MYLTGSIKKIGALALTLAACVTTQANAGFIDMDFTTTTGLMSGVATSSAAVSGFGPATISVDLQGQYAAYDLNIQGYRSSIPDGRNMRLTRTVTGDEHFKGIGLCSRVDAFGGGCTLDQDAVDGFGADESIKFSISPVLSFAVQTITFGQIYDNDDAMMRFQFGTLSIDISIAAAPGPCTSEPGLFSGHFGHGRICTVNVYDLVQAALVGDQSELDIFNYLASTDGFTFTALDDNDNFFIRGARWVTVPEPASMTLLGAGFAALGYFGKRRRA